MTDTPPVLAGVGEVFVPIPPGEKGTRRPRTPENLFAFDNPVFQAYLEAGHNYGVTCRGDIAVVDANEPDRLRALLDALPETAWQVSGSRTSKHHFLRVPELDAELPLVDPESGDELGHIKGAVQSYVVGPESTHPSGTQYGPLGGDETATVEEDALRDLIDPFRPTLRSDRPLPTPARRGQPPPATTTTTSRFTTSSHAGATPRGVGASTRSTGRTPARTSWSTRAAIPGAAGGTDAPGTRSTSSGWSRASFRVETGSTAG